MNINNKFIYAKRKSLFELIKSQIPKDLNPIVFIEDESLLYTCGTYFNLGYPEVKVMGGGSQVLVKIGHDSFNLATSGSGLSIQSEGNTIVLNSQALTRINTDGILEWDDVKKILSHSKTLVNPGSYGQSSSITDGASSFVIPNITVNDTGHVVSAVNNRVVIRDYTQLLQPDNKAGERNLLTGNTLNSDLGEAAPTRKAGGLLYNDFTKKLTVEGGIHSNSGVSIDGGDLVVTNGLIVGELKGSITGTAIPKIHLSEKPEYGGASTKSYGHVILRDDLPTEKPTASSDNTDKNNGEVIAIAASPLMVWDALQESLKYTDQKGVTITAIDKNKQKHIKLNLNFTEDFIIDEEDNLSLRWHEI